MTSLREDSEDELLQVEATESRERGRPTDYQPIFAKQAKLLCQRGATDPELAEFFDVSRRTIERWRIQHKDFCRATKIGKDIADDVIERSLFTKAKGYSIQVEKCFFDKESGCVVKETVTEHVPPDTAAAIFWLKNRRKDVWRDKQDVDHNHVVTISQEFETHLKALQASRHEPLTIEHAPKMLDAAE